MAIYLDSSAIVKLAVREPESAALRRYLRRKRPLVSSVLARTEVLRALLPSGEPALRHGSRALALLELLRVNAPILNAAGLLLPEELRSLDAIHLSTARLLGDDLRAFVCYDERLIAAAKQLGCRVVSPH